MKLWRCFAVVAVLLAAPPVEGRELPTPPKDAGRYVVFIHFAGNNAKELVRLQAALAERGYLVRPPDQRQDERKDGIVEYFDDTDEIGARDIADVVNNVLYKGEETAKPRFRPINTQPGTIGVWLSGAATQ